MSSAPRGWIITAYAVVYVIWGSTYFFIQEAVKTISPLLLGSFRFLAAGMLMLVWCGMKGEKLFNPISIKNAAITGLLLLFIGNGSVMYAEQYIPSGIVAVLVGSSPIWFVLLDFPNFKTNIRSTSVITGLITGFAGVILLFSDNLDNSSGSLSIENILALLLLIIGPAAWAGGSIFSKYNPSKGSPALATAWQMFSAGLIFSIVALFNGEISTFDSSSVSTNSWLSIAYLTIFGSIAGFSAYVWLLKVEPVTRVSTYAYVNPVVAVLMGVFLAGEKISFTQVIGLVVILLALLLLNLEKYRNGSRRKSA